MIFLYKNINHDFFFNIKHFLEWQELQINFQNVRNVRMMKVKWKYQPECTEKIK